MVMVVYSSYFGNIVQEFYRLDMGKYSKCCRYYDNGTWEELEWVNPPMELGVEYRTTERWGGKPVYTKAVFIPTLPNNTHINSPISGKKTVLSAEGYATDLSTGVDYMFPVVGYSDGKITATFMHSVGDDFYIKTYVDLSNWSANFIVKYTKD